MEIVYPDHATVFLALLIGILTEGGSRYLWRRQIGQGPPPSPFFVIIDFNLQPRNQISIFPEA